MRNTIRNPLEIKFCPYIAEINEYHTYMYHTYMYHTYMYHTYMYPRKGVVIGVCAAAR